MAQEREVQDQQNSQQAASQEQLRKQRRPIIDLFVGLFAIPMLIFCAIKLEQHMNSTWETSSETGWMIFALGICMLLISLIIIGYVTHRLGVCLWAGPLEGTPSISASTAVYNNYVDTGPPSYDSVIDFDTSPPPYEWVVINIENTKMAGLKTDTRPNGLLNKVYIKEINNEVEALPPSYEEISIHI